MTISTQTKNKNLDSINVYPLKVLKVTASAFCKIFGIDNWARWVSVDVRCTTEEVLRKVRQCRWWGHSPPPPGSSLLPTHLLTAATHSPAAGRWGGTHGRGQAGIKQQMTEMPHIGAHIQQNHTLLFYPKTFFDDLVSLVKWLHVLSFISRISFQDESDVLMEKKSIDIASFR